MSGEDVYAALFETIKVPIVACDQDWRIVASNRAALDFLGCARDAIEGHTLPEVFAREEGLTDLMGHEYAEDSSPMFTVRTGESLEHQQSVRVRFRQSVVPDSRGWRFLFLSSLEDTIFAPEDQRQIRAETLHRIRNTVMTIRYLATYTAEGAESLDDFLGVFRDRVDTTCRAVSLTGADGGASVDLAEVVGSQLTSYGLSEGDNLAISGPDALVAVPTGIACALTLNELAAYSTKWGALREDEGGVEVSWQIEEGAQAGTGQGNGAGVSHVCITWREPGPESTDFAEHIDELANGLPSKLGAIVRLRGDGNAIEVRVPRDVAKPPPAKVAGYAAVEGDEPA